MLLSYKRVHLQAQQRLQEEGCVADIKRRREKDLRDKAKHELCARSSGRGDGGGSGQVQGDGSGGNGNGYGGNYGLGQGFGPYGREGDWGPPPPWWGQ